MHLSSLVEIKRWVMWWGMDCEVVEPKELRDIVALEVQQMLRRSESSGAIDLAEENGSGRGRKKARRGSGR